MFLGLSKPLKPFKVLFRFLFVSYQIQPFYGAAKLTQLRKLSSLPRNSLFHLIFLAAETRRSLLRLAYMRSTIFGGVPYSFLFPSSFLARNTAQVLEAKPGTISDKNISLIFNTTKFSTPNTGSLLTATKCKPYL